jgi:hypothetical protein
LRGDGYSRERQDLEPGLIEGDQIFVDEAIAYPDVLVRLEPDR